MARHVLDIFLSSTSEDMREFRTTVMDVLTRLGQFAVRMETFGAKPNKPLSACREEVGQSDALIVIVGHRYGWIPSTADGGDDTRSITRWEVQWALEAHKPVYAFPIDPKAPWTGPREQDRVVAATTEAEMLGVWRAGVVSHLPRESDDTGAVQHCRSPGQPGRHEPVPWLLEKASPVPASTAAWIWPQHRSFRPKRRPSRLASGSGDCRSSSTGMNSFTC